MLQDKKEKTGVRDLSSSPLWEEINHQVSSPFVERVDKLEC